ncbi:MAG: hypothetical protein R3335_07180 [Anaerolineales bacterium]|nr:hypothetical protein [Anaerolineales bacterium]
MSHIYRTLTLVLIAAAAVIALSLIPGHATTGRASSEGGTGTYLPLITNNYQAGLGSVSGVISDALDGRLLSGLNDEAQVCYQGTCYLADSSGNYSISGLPSGARWLTGRAQGYVDFNILVIINAEANIIQNFPLSPDDLSEGQVRIILTWDADPPDLDAHLWTPFDINGIPHVYQANPGDCDGIPPTEVCLDIDDVDGWGPETITILEAPPAGTAFFQYAVEKFDPCFPPCPNPIEDAFPVVNVFGETSMGGFQETFVIPQQGNTGKRFWYVFDIEYDDFGFVGIITKNCFTDAPNPFDDPPTCPP